MAQKFIICDQCEKSFSQNSASEKKFKNRWFLEHHIVLFKYVLSSLLWDWTASRLDSVWFSLSLESLTSLGSSSSCANFLEKTVV